MKPHITSLLTLLALSCLVILTPAAATADRLDEAEVFIEINDTDGDAGLQIFLDSEGWDRMQLLDTDGNVLLTLGASGGVGQQGLTEGFFESAEPSFDVQSLDEFLALFPEGTYRFRGRTTDNVPLRGKAELTHALPAAPILVSPADGDDDVDPDNTVLEWIGSPDPPGSEIVGYQVIVETEEPRLLEFVVDVGPEVTSVTVPPEFMEAGNEYKYEVLAIEDSGNKTISEAEFETADED